MVEAVLWDNDGVLVDTEAIFFEITRQAFARVGVVLTPDYWAHHYLGAGKRSGDVAAELGVPAPQIERVLAERNDTFRQRLQSPVPLRPGVRETLEALRGRVRLALVTGSSRESLDLVHRHTGLLPWFECIVTKEHFEYSKPDPEAYLTALRRLGLTAERCLAVEDSPRGLAAAVAAGLRCVLVPTELTALDLCAPGARIRADATAVLGMIASEE
jgi:HAD superfamily hydrolase (TIGR01509 family)